MIIRWCVLLLLLLANPILAADTLVKPFKAQYKAEYSGFDITATRELTQTDNHTAKITFDASAWLGSIKESSRFKADGEIITPIVYEYERSGLGKNKQLGVQFDTETQTLINNNNGKKQALPIDQPMFDPLTYQLQLQADVASGKTDVTYTIADGKRLKHYRFKVVKQETLKTPLGLLETTRVERIKEKSDKSTTLWFANQWDYLLVKVERREDDTDYSIDLVNATVNGHPVTQSQPSVGQHYEH